MNYPPPPPAAPPPQPQALAELPVAAMMADDLRRDRLLSALTVILGTGLLLAAPFALQAGASFFLPLTAALVVALALVPLLEWLEARRLPSALAAAVALALFIALVNGALALVAVPASGWFARLPQSLPRIQDNLAPLLEFYREFEAFINRSLQSVATGTEQAAAAIGTGTPESVLDYLLTSAPAAGVQLLFGVLVIYFFLAGWSDLRRSLAAGPRTSPREARSRELVRSVIDATARYLATITAINVLLGAAVAGVMWWLGLPSPLMWGGIAALGNYIPYIGPIVVALLLAVGGLMSFDSVGAAMMPVMAFFALNLIEAYVVTPMVLGRRLTLNPLWIMISLSFWGWVWGAPGALLAVPLLLVIQAVFNVTGVPNFGAFLFGSGTLVRTAR